jgi:aspartyl-tRNA(Asn)/glutamyl-tRNA(Gln) amidotransferase subunit A
LKEAGAVLICKTTMPDFGMLAAASSSFHELTRNPWDLNANPGGSSSGAAAAAAAGYGPLHVGTDIGGSVRIPASFCGVFGLKPSVGRVPIDPPYPGRVAGPITRTVRDASLLMSVLSQPDVRDFMNLPYQEQSWNELEDVSLRGLRIGLWLTPGYGVKLDPEVESAVSKAATHFQAAGAEIELISNWVQQDMFNAFRTFSTMRLRMDTAPMSAAQRDRMLPLLQRAAASSVGLTAEALYAAQVKIMEMRAVTVRATHGFDYVLSPVAPHPAFAAEAPCFDAVGFDSMGDIVFTLPFNVSEQPAASINCGYSTAGLPIGLQIIGRRFDDLGVLRLSRHYEKVRETQKAYPSVESIARVAH